MKDNIIPVLNHNKFDFTEMYGNDAAIYLKESIITEPIVFNQEAKVILSYINGTNTIDDISEIVRKKYKEADISQIKSDILNELRVLWGLKILDFKGFDPFKKEIEENYKNYLMTYVREISDKELDKQKDFVCGFWNKEIDYTGAMLNSGDEAGILKMFRLQEGEKAVFTIGITYNINISIFEIKFITGDISNKNVPEDVIKNFFGFINKFFTRNKAMLQYDYGKYFIIYVNEKDIVGKRVVETLFMEQKGRLKQEFDGSDVEVFASYVT